MPPPEEDRQEVAEGSPACFMGCVDAIADGFLCGRFEHLADPFGRIS
jgi:hypothetical protein